MTRPTEDALTRIAIERGMLTAAQADEARAEYRAEPSPPSFCTWMVDRGLLTRDQAGELLLRQSEQAPTEAPERSARTMAAAPGGETIGAGPTAALPVRTLDKYEVLRELGRGGMGVVYQAWHPGLKTHFAIKALLQGEGASGEALQRFRREAQALARLRHPGIVAVHDIWDEGGRTYLAMEFVEGKGLDRVLGEGPLPAPEAIRTTRAIAEAIEYAHEQGVLHRDLKPANVLRLPDGRVKVMDFGLAKMVEPGEASVTRTGALMGTPAYMSPEQVDEGIHAIDARSDVYQVGAILYEMLTGSRPYRGDTEMAVLMQVAHREPASPRAVNPRVERDAETICLKAMARERENRYPTARALAEDCRRFLEGEPIQARRASLALRAARWARRRKALAALAAAALLATGAAGLAGWRAQAAERDKALLQTQVLEGLRTLARLNLDATLMVRRNGGRMAEARARFLVPLEEAARAALAQAPGLAEPHYHVGRMYRALLRFTEAKEAQERALASDPGYAPARYERAVLNAQAFGERMVELRTSWLRGEGRSAARGARPPDEALAAADPAARALRAALQEDLAWLEAARASGAQLSAARMDCAAGLALLYAGKPDERVRAREKLDAALAQEERLEEAIEGLARAALLDQDLAAAVAAYDRGLKADEGYVPFRTGRGDVRMHEAMLAAQRGEDPSTRNASAIEDYDAALALDDECPRAWMARGVTRCNAADWSADHGRDAEPDYRAAVADLERATALDPAGGQAWLALAVARSGWGNWTVARGADAEALYDAAAADFGRALEHAADSPEARSKRANLHMNRGVWAQQQGRDPGPHYQAALDDCARARELDPRSIEPLLVSGLAHSGWGVWRHERGEDPRPTYERAIADLGAAIELAPDQPEPWARRGGVRQNWGYWLLGRGADPGEQHAAAEADFAEALKLHPGLARARLGRGDVRTHAGLWREARGEDPTETYAAAQADYDAAIEADPDAADAWLRRGMVRANWGNARTARGGDPSALYESAVADLGKAVELNPRLADAWLKRGDTRANWAVWRKAAGLDPRPLYGPAEEDYGRALALNPASADAWAARGLVRAHWGQELQERGEDPGKPFADAEADYAESLARNPNRAATWMKRAMLRVTRAVGAQQAGRDATAEFAAAGGDFDRAVELAPGDAEARWRRGWLRYVTMRFAESVADFEKAKELNPASAAIFQRVLDKAKKRVEAGEGK